MWNQFHLLLACLRYRHAWVIFCILIKFNMTWANFIAIIHHQVGNSPLTWWWKVSGNPPWLPEEFRFGNYIRQFGKIYRYRWELSKRSLSWAYIAMIFLYAKMLFLVSGRILDNHHSGSPADHLKEESHWNCWWNKPLLKQCRRYGSKSFNYDSGTIYQHLPIRVLFQA